MLARHDGGMSLPEPIAGVRWRFGTARDVDVVAAVLAAADRVDEPGYIRTAEDVASAFATTDPSTSVVVGDRDGEPVAAGVLFRPGSGAVRLWGAVVPAERGRGIGRVLLRQQITSAAEVHADLPTLGLRAIGDGGVAHLAQRFGFAPVRYFLTMRRDLADPVRPAPLPADVRIVPFTSDLDEPLRLLKNEVFRDHWGGIADDPEEWQARTLGPRLIRDLSRIAVGGGVDGGIVAFVVVWRLEEHPWRTYIDLVGTAREQRGRGLASALLASTLRAARVDGFAETELDVDASSETGAGRVYESAGFVEVQRATVWQRALLAPRAPRG